MIKSLVTLVASISLISQATCTVAEEFSQSHYQIDRGLMSSLGGCVVAYDLIGFGRRSEDVAKEAKLIAAQYTEFEHIFELGRSFGGALSMYAGIFNASGPTSEDRARALKHIEQHQCERRGLQDG